MMPWFYTKQSYYFFLARKQNYYFGSVFTKRYTWNIQIKWAQSILQGVGRGEQSVHQIIEGISQKKSKDS
jgi:hypothetical protein